MNSKKFRSASLVIATLILAGLFLGAFSTRGAAVAPPPVPASIAGETGSGGFVFSKSAPGWTAATRPWTKEEMLAAKPYPAPAADSTAAIDLSNDGPEGKAGFVPSALAMDARAPAVDFVEPDILSPGAPLGYSYPAPFTRYTNSDAFTKYPYVTVGKLFFTQYGNNFVCSAASIGNYGIWTAGHCVHAGNGLESGWSYNIVFVPAYKLGNAPKGQWLGAYAGTTGAWFNNSDLRYDYGGVVLNTLGGNKISQVVGSLGFAWNQSRDLHWFIIGYPAQAPFTGQRQVICAASHAYDYIGFGTPYPTGVGCDMTGGSSGGPWIWQFRFQAGPSNYLNGNVSFGRNGFPLEMFTPYFNGDTRNFHLALVGAVP